MKKWNPLGGEGEAKAARILALHPSLLFCINAFCIQESLYKACKQH